LMAFPLVLVLVLSAILIPMLTAGANLRSEDNITASALDEQTSESTQMLRGMPRNVYFDITSSSTITNENLRYFVRVVDIREFAVAVGVEQRNGFFRVMPPTELYESGEAYLIELQNAQFRDERLRNQTSVMFTISGEERNDVVMNDDVIEIAQEYIRYFNDESGELIVNGNGVAHRVGDIIMVQTYFYGVYVDAALRVTGVTTRQNGDVILETEKPYIDEVFDELEIYGSFEPNPEDIHFFSEEELQEKILEHQSVRAISFAVAQMSSAPSIVPLNTTTARPRGVPYSVSMSISGITFMPFQVRGNLRISWRIPVSRPNDFGVANNNLNVVVNVSFSVQVENYLNISAESDRYSSGTITTTTLSVSVDAYFSGSYGVALLSRSERMKRMMEKAYEFAAPYNMMSAENLASMRYKRNELTGFDDLRYWHNDRMEVYDRKVQNQLRVLDALANEYKNQQQGIGAGIVPLFIKPIPVMPGVMFWITAGLVFDIDLQAGFKAEYTVRQVETNGQITTEDGTVDYQNTVTTHSVSIMFYGRLNIRVGLGIELRLTIAVIFYVSVSATGGGYITAHGAIAAHWDNGEGDPINFFQGNQAALFGVDPERGRFNNWLAGTGSIEAGGFFSATIRVGVRFRVLFVSVDISTTIPIWERTWPITTNENETPYLNEDLVVRNAPVQITSSGGRYVPLNSDYIEHFATHLQNRISFSNQNNYAHQLSYVYRRTIDLENRNVIYSPVNPRDIRLVESVQTSINHNGYLFPTRFEDFMISDIVMIMATDRYGRRLEHLTTLLHTHRDPIAIESIELHTIDGGNTIRIAQPRLLTTTVLPSNASFPDATFVVESVIAGGRIITGAGVNRYVQISSSGAMAHMVASRYMRPGDVIRIIATGIDGGVRSNVLELTVERTPVEEVHLIPQNNVTSVLIGQTLPFEIITCPEDSTFALIGELANVSIINSELGHVERVSGNRFNLIVTNDMDMLGEQIELRVIINDDGNHIERRAFFNIRQIHLAGLSIDGLTNSNEVNQGDTIRLSPILNPVDATLQTRINFATNRNNEFVYIYGSELRVRPNAPIGFTFTVTALYGHIASRNYSFTVVAIPVEIVAISLPVTEAAPGDMFALSSTVLPAHATHRNVTFEVIHGSQWSYIHHGNFLVIRNTVPLGTVIAVRGVADGVLSNMITVTVPLRAIIIASTTSILRAGNSLQIDHQFNPSPNAISPVQFFIYSGGTFGTITPSGMLTVHNNVSTTVPVIIVQARNLGVYSNRIAINVDVPVRTVTMSSESENGRTRVGNSVRLFADISPRYASNQEVTFEVEENQDYAFVFNGRLIVNMDNVTIGARVGVVAIVDGVRSSIYRIELLPVPVTQVTFSTQLDLRLAYGSSYTLSAVVAPAFATFNQVSFRIVSGGQFGQIVGNQIRVNDNTPIGSTIQIKATADGVDSESVLVVIVTRVLVQNITLETSGSLQRVVPGSTLQFIARIAPDNATLRNANFVLVDGYQFATINRTTGELVILPARYFQSVRGRTLITVHVSLDGKSDRISFYVDIPIDNIVIDAPALDETPSFELEMTFKVILRPDQPERKFVNITETINPYFATCQKITLSIIEGEEFAILENGMLLIHNKIQVPNAVIRIQAYAQGVYSNILRFNIYVPVKSVTILYESREIMLGEELSLGYEINPTFATSQEITFSFVDNNGEPIAIPAQYGIVINPRTGLIQAINTRSIDPGWRTLRVRAFAGGIGSDILIVTIVPRPVIEIYYYVYGSLTVNPNTEGHQISAVANNDATNRQLHFRIVGINLQDSDITNRWGVKDGYTYTHFITFRVPVHAINGTIRIYIESDDGYYTRIITFDIKRIYATAISSVVMLRNGTTPIDNRDDFPAGLGNMAMVRPGEFIDIEAVNLNVFNATFANYWQVEIDSPFAEVVNGRIVIHQLSVFHAQMNTNNNSFIATIELWQGDNEKLKLVYTREIRVFVAIDITPNSTRMTQSSVGMPNSQGIIPVDRHRGNDPNSFIFDFVINNGLYSSFPEVDVRLTPTIPGLPVTMPRYNGFVSNSRPLSVDFISWHAGGTSFRFELHVLNNHGIEEILLSFTLVVRTLNSSHNATFLGYSINHNANGGNPNNVTLAGKAGLLALPNGSHPASGWSHIPRLLAGHSVHPHFGDSILLSGGASGVASNFRGARVTLTTVTPHLGGISNGRINIAANATDGQLFIFRMTYNDGSPITRYFAIQVVQRFTAAAEIVAVNDQAAFIDTINPNLAGRFVINNQIRQTTSTVRFTAVDATRSPFTIDGTQINVTHSTTRHEIYVRVTFVQNYNNAEFTDARTDFPLLRRFVTTQQNLANINSAPRRDEHPFILRSDINLHAWIPIGTFYATLDGYDDGVIRTITISWFAQHGAFITGSIEIPVSENNPNSGFVRINRGTIRNITFSGQMRHSSTRLINDNWFHVGMVAGRNYGLIESVTVFDAARTNSSVSPSTGVNYSAQNMDISMVIYSRKFVGGIVGSNQSTGVIRNSTNNAAIFGRGDVGGIAGYNRGRLENNTNNGRIHHAPFRFVNNSIGGIVGHNTGTGIVRYNRNYGHIFFEGRSESSSNRAPHIGQIIGRNSGGATFAVNWSMTDTVHRGTLRTVSSGFLWLGNTDQFRYTGNRYVGRNG